jgi:hypothetical protein
MAAVHPRTLIALPPADQVLPAHDGNPLRIRILAKPGFGTPGIVTVIDIADLQQRGYATAPASTTFPGH